MTAPSQGLCRPPPAAGSSGWSRPSPSGTLLWKTTPPLRRGGTVVLPFPQLPSSSSRWGPASRPVRVPMGGPHAHPCSQLPLRLVQKCGRETSHRWPQAARGPAPRPPPAARHLPEGTVVPSAFCARGLNALVPHSLRRQGQLSCLGSSGEETETRTGGNSAESHSGQGTPGRTLRPPRPVLGFLKSPCRSAEAHLTSHQTGRPNCSTARRSAAASTFALLRNRRLHRLQNFLLFPS